MTRRQVMATTGAVLMAVVLWGVAGMTGACAQALPVVPPGDIGLMAERLATIKPLVEAEIAAGNLPGCVVCVGRGGRIGWLEAIGDRQVGPDAEPMTVDTIFDLASLTKPVATATAIMQLVEEGKLRLSDTVASLFPAFAAKGKEKITVRDLLVHTSGLIADNALADYADGPEKAIERIMDLEPLAPPGERFIYSDVNFILLGELVAKLSGRPLAEQVRERICRPLGMADTGFLPAAELRPRIAPTEPRDGAPLRGAVHDPRAWKLGGAAGHAGLFGTAPDLAVYASALLAAGHGSAVAGSAVAGSAVAGSAAPILGPRAVAEMTRPWRVPGGGMRGLGWDKRSGFSSNRSDLYTDTAFGHGGFTGTSLWIDPRLDLFVIFLSSRLHPDGKGLVNPLAARIGSVAVAAIGTPTTVAEPARQVRTGIDVLVRDGFRQLAGRRVGLITNHTGRTHDGRTTPAALGEAKGLELVALFSPEHGFAGALDQSDVPDAKDPATGLPVRSLYGKTRRPTPEMLADLDTLVYDIQDIGCRFYTYVSTMGEAMKAAAEQGKRFVVLDRPNPINGIDVAGPMLDPGSESFVGWHTLPLRHGMTVGELARLFNEELKLGLDLVVVPCEGWRRADAWEATGLEWVNPSPNMRSLTEAFLYPGIGLLETTNVSVGRGTDTPFEVIGSPWIDGPALAAALAARGLPGVAFVPLTFTPDASTFKNERCGGVNVLITDRAAFDPVRTGLEIAAALRRLHPEAWKVDGYGRLLASKAVLDAIRTGGDPQGVVDLSAAGLREFHARRTPHLLYD
ncbi:MAG: exo-beta-N-acetylmuramidase NamZ domain-containing protein [Pirellulales bacterium]